MPAYQIKAPDGNTYSIDGPEGATDEQVRAKVLEQHPQAGTAPAPGMLERAGDFAKGLGVGAAQAAEHFPGAMASMIGAAGRFVEPALESVGIGDPEERKKREAFRAENPLHFATEGLKSPESAAGRYGKSIGEFIPATMAGPGGWLSRISTAFAGGAGAEKAAEIVADPGSEPYARIIGGFIGSFFPTFLARAANPLPATQRHLQDVGALAQEGVTNLTAGMRAGKRGVRYVEEHYGQSPLAGAAAQERLDLPYEQFTRAALRRIGENAQRADPAVVERAGRRIGRDFDQMSAAYNADLAVHGGQQYVQSIMRAQHDYDFLFMDPLRRPIVENIVDHALNKVTRSNTMSGGEYKALRERLERMRRGSTDTHVNQFIAEVRDAMDGLMERAIGQINSADLGAWREIRNQYRNLLAIEQATTGAESHGLIAPAKLKQAAVGQNRRSYARGEGDFGELARAGERVMGSLPQSGTAPRQQYTAGVTKLLSTGVAGRLMMSPGGQAWLGNQELTNLLRDMPSAKRTALISILSQLPAATREEAPR